MYGALSPELQEIVLFNYRYSSSLFFIFCIFVVSIIYIFYYKNNVEKPTKSFAVGISRILFTIMAYVTIFLTPFAKFLVNPAVEENAFINVFIIFYYTYISFFVLILIFDFLRYAPFLMLKLGGFDIKDPEVDKVYRTLENEFNKLPFVKNGGIK